MHQTSLICSHENIQIIMIDTPAAVEQEEAAE
jgi:GTPase Era involved in 16S rRNA processing